MIEECDKKAEAESNDESVRLVALLAVSTSAFLTIFMAGSAAVALPSIARQFRMDPVSQSWIMTSFLLALGVFLVPIGRLADMYGRKRVYLLGVAVLAATSLACAAANSGLVLVICRFFQGAGAAMVYGPGVAILSSVFPPEERGKAMGIYIGIVYLAMSLSPFLGGVLTFQLGWRYIFLVALPAAALVIPGVLLKLKGEWVTAKGEPFDYPGAVIWGAVLVASICGMTRMPSPTAAILILAGAAGVLLFIKRERAADHPMLDVDLFRQNRMFTFTIIASLIGFCATFAVTFLLSLYLQSVRAITPQTAGIILVSQPIVQGIVTLFAGKASDTVEARILASTGMAIIVAGLVLFSFLSNATPISFVVAVLAVLGFGFGLFSAPNAAAIVSAVPQKYLGVVSGTLLSTSTVGQILSMGVTSLVFALYVRGARSNLPEPARLLQSMRLLFVVFSLICLIGLFFSLARGKPRSTTT